MTHQNSKPCNLCGISMDKPSKYSYPQWNKKIYCSNACRALRSKIGRTKKCLNCGNEFYYRPSMRVGSYCSRSCAQKNKTNALGKHNVSITGREKMKLAHLGKKATQSHKQNMRIAQIKRFDKIGRKERNRSYHMRDSIYRQWRSDVFQRDNWTCQTCQVKGVYLEAHHIKGWAKYPELRLEMTNGVALCRECHKLTNNYKNKK